MSSERKADLHLEIAHVLFMDVVGFSKLLINDQSEILSQLNQLVRNAPHFREAEAEGKLIRLATGDGMALVFSNNAEAPVECALEISEALKTHPQVQLRMGIHSGPVNAVNDVNDRSNVTGLESTWRNGSWIAATPATSCSLGVWRKISSNTGNGSRACMILVSAK
jgi:class 3 adenylate cyclase